MCFNRPRNNVHFSFHCDLLVPGHLLLPSAQLVFHPVCMALVMSPELAAAGCASHLALLLFSQMIHTLLTTRPTRGQNKKSER